MQLGILILVVLAGLTPHTASQRACRNTSAVLTATAGSQKTLSCTVPAELNILVFYVWEWNQLAADGSVHTSLPLTADVSVESTDHSTYTLNIDCTHNGMYQAVYLNASAVNEECVYSCLYVLEVHEVEESVLLDAFSIYSVQTPSDSIPSSPSDFSTNKTFPESTSNITVGTCSPMIHLPSGCTVVANSSTWYKDGERLSASNLYYNDFEFFGELLIHNLTTETVGYYVCLTVLPSELGSYRTVDVFIGLIPSPEPSATAIPPTESEEQDETLVFDLETWEVGVILGGIVIVILLVLCVSVSFVWLYLKKNRRHLEDSGRLEESEVETVDFGHQYPPQVPFNAILIEELLHKGTFKVVHHAIVDHRPLGMKRVHVAVKRLKDENSELGMAELMAEASILRAIHDKAGTHPNIVSFLGMTAHGDGGFPCLLLEYVNHGTLDTFLWSLKKGPIPEWYLGFVRETLRGVYPQHVSGDLMSILRQTAEGMRFLTEHGFIHRDLSTRNIMVGDRLQVKITNLGMYQEGYYYAVTEREHFLQDMAPECMWDKRYSVWSDVWSFGILSYKVITLESNPFPGVPARELYDSIISGQRPQLLSSFSNELYFLLQRCLQSVAMERPTFASLLSELTDLAEDPSRHIILRTSKDEYTPGFLTEDGKVFLRSLPSRALDGNRHQISSIDDAIYTPDTVECKPENDNYTDAIVKNTEGLGQWNTGERGLQMQLLGDKDALVANDDGKETNEPCDQSEEHKITRI